MTAVHIDEKFGRQRAASTAAKAVIRLLRTVPAQHLVGLSAVVLTHSAAQKSARTWRLHGRKWRSNESYGIYHRRKRTEEPWIQLVVDHVLADWPPILLRLPVFQDLALAPTLYHEIGHHVHSAVGGTRDRERAAEEWSRTFARLYFRRTYWYLNPLVAPALRLVRLVIWLQRPLKPGRIQTSDDRK